MGFWTKSRLIFNAFRDNTKASIRQVALQTGLSKRSVHRLWQAMVGRNQHPESWFWETKEAQNERGCHQRQCSYSTHVFRHL
jgi:hypothetical protein